MRMIPEDGSPPRKVNWDSCGRAVDPSASDEGDQQSDSFRMFSFKIQPCPLKTTHPWESCAYAHPHENARRRDPRFHKYIAEACPDYKQGLCLLGAKCPYAHGVYERNLHPSKYRTQLCTEGPHCSRRVCFFAHNPSQQRAPQYVWFTPEVAAYVRAEQLERLLCGKAHVDGSQGIRQCMSQAPMSSMESLSSIQGVNPMQQYQQMSQTMQGAGIHNQQQLQQHQDLMGQQYLSAIGTVASNTSPASSVQAPLTPPANYMRANATSAVMQGFDSHTPVKYTMPSPTIMECVQVPEARRQDDGPRMSMAMRRRLEASKPHVVANLGFLGKPMTPSNGIVELGGQVKFPNLQDPMDTTFLLTPRLIMDDYESSTDTQQRVDSHMWEQNKLNMFPRSPEHLFPRSRAEDLACMQQLGPQVYPGGLGLLQDFTAFQHNQYFAS